MEKFVYRARSRQGEPISGKILASNLEEAGKILVTQGKFVVEISPVKDDSKRGFASRAAAGILGSGKRRVGRKPIIDFANQIAVIPMPCR